MIPLPAEVKECLQKSIRLTSYTPFNQLICCISVSSYMLTRRFAVHLNRSLVGLLGIVIEKTDVAYLRSFPCVVVKKTSSRRQKISMILQFAPLIDQISVPVLGAFVVLLVDVDCLKKCTAMVKVGLSRFQKPTG